MIKIRFKFESYHFAFVYMQNACNVTNILSDMRWDIYISECELEYVRQIYRP